MRAKDMTTEKRNKVVQFLLESCVGGKPPRGKLLEAKNQFNISRQTVWRLWSAAKKQKAKGEMIHLVSGKKSRKTSKLVILDLVLLKSLQHTRRGDIRSISFGLNVSKSTVGRWVLAGMIKSHTANIKPDLTASNKLLRMRFSLEALELDRILNKIKFKDMHNIVHIDEKWFYITKGSHKFYLAPDEEVPYRSCKSKKFIGKIMFMCAVARPLFGPNGDVLFDGKIGIFPFTTQVPAKRNSRNRPAGTLETKPIDSITRLVIKDCLINKIIPSIMEKWPEGARRDIYIQQDNARPHIKDSDADFRVAASQNGFNIHLVQQPPNSPDTNINDLGWFRSIQALQVKTACKNIDELLEAVVSSFQSLSAVTLNNVFLSLQGCMIEILKVKGHNAYTQPHMGKEALIRADLLPLTLEVPHELAQVSINYLSEMGALEGLMEIGQTLDIALEGTQD